MTDQPAAGAMTLGIDPGPNNSGWALIDFTIPSAPVWFEGGNTNRIDALFQMLKQRELSDHIHLVAIEQAVALWNPMANVQTMATAWAGGWAAGYAEALGFNVVALGANQWRVALVGESRRGDDVDGKVKAALRSLVRHFPARSNVHVRDAGAVACVATRDWRHARRLQQHARNLETIRGTR